MFLTAFHAITAFALLHPWLSALAALAPAAPVVARLISRGVEAVVEYVKKAAVLLNDVLAGGVVTRRRIKRERWGARNVEFAVTIRQLYDPRLRRLCWKLLALVQWICDSPALAQCVAPLEARKLSGHDVAARAGTKRCRQIERHILVLRGLAFRPSSVKGG